MAQRAAGFDMEVIHTHAHDTGLPGYVATLDELLERSDIVSLHVPLSDVDPSPDRRGASWRA